MMPLTDRIGICAASSCAVTVGLMDLPDVAKNTSGSYAEGRN